MASPDLLEVVLSEFRRADGPRSITQVHRRLASAWSRPSVRSAVEALVDAGELRLREPSAGNRGALYAPPQSVVSRRSP